MNLVLEFRILGAYGFGDALEDKLQTVRLRCERVSGPTLQLLSACMARSRKARHAPFLPSLSSCPSSSGALHTMRSGRGKRSEGRSTPVWLLRSAQGDLSRTHDYSAHQVLLELGGIPEAPGDGVPQRPAH